MAGSKAVRPSWLVGVEKRDSGALLSVRRSDGSKHGLRVSRTSLVARAAEERSVKVS